jgi:hypothetical protein
VHDITQRKSYHSPNPKDMERSRSLEMSKSRSMEMSRPPHHQHESDRAERLSLVSERSIRETIREEKEASGDEKWKDQLYKASVKFQKSPSHEFTQVRERFLQIQTSYYEVLLDQGNASPLLPNKALIRMSSVSPCVLSPMHACSQDLAS